MSWAGEQISRVSVLAANHPRAALLVSLVLVAVSTVGVLRIQLASSLAAMIGSGSPASEAFIRIAEDYHTSDELMLLCTVPGGHDTHGTDDADEVESGLVGFAERFSEAAGADPELNGMIQSLRYREDAEISRFIAEQLIPSAPYFMSDRGFEELLDRLTLDGMRRQFRRAEAMLSAPGAGTERLVQQTLQDPLRLAELIDRSALSSAGTNGNAQGSGPPPLLLSQDQRTLMIRIAGARQVDDLVFAAAFTDRVRAVSDRVNTEGISLELAGGYAIATTTSRGIRADMIRSVVVAAVLVHVLFFLVYRRLLAPILVVVMAGMGIWAGFSIQGFGGQVVTPLGAMIAAMLAGLGVDYGIHLLSHYQVERSRTEDRIEATQRSVRGVGGAILASGLTTAIGFGSMAFSEVTMLRSFGIIGATCLVGCLLTVLVLMPATFGLLERRSVDRAPRFSSLAMVISRRTKACLTVGVLLLVVQAALLTGFGWAPRVETDLSRMHPRPNAALDTTDSLPARFDGVGEWLPVQIQGATDTEMLTTAHRVRTALAGPEAQALGIVQSFGVHSLLPEPALAARRAQTLRTLDPEDITAAFKISVSESVFLEDQLREYSQRVAQLVRAPIPQLEQLRGFRSIASKMLPDETSQSGPSRSLLVVQCSQSLSERAARDTTIEGLRNLLGPIDGVTLSGVTAVAYDLERATRGDLLRLVSYAGVLILVCLLLVLRRPILVMYSLIPMASGTLLMLTAMSVGGLGMNALNGAAIPLLLGITVDAGVILVAYSSAGTRHRTRDRARDRTRDIDFGPAVQAVVVASLTTLIGFGAVCLSSTPAIRSLGMLTCVGVVGSTAGALLILVPILMQRARAA